jgi:hypothetical protein
MANGDKHRFLRSLTGQRLAGVLASAFNAFLPKGCALQGEVC